jgi:hypothetical protein
VKAIRLAMRLAMRLVLALWTSALWAADTVTLVNGESKTGRVLGMEQELLLLSTQPIPGLPEVDVRIPKGRVAAVAFGADEPRDTFLQNALQRDLPKLAELWKAFSPFLPVQGSPTARIGLRYALLLLEADSAAARIDTLPIFEKIAAVAPVRQEQEAAKQGILRTLLRTGQWTRAESEALSLAVTPCGAALLAEARLTAGLVQKYRLRTFTEENPRWKFDEFVRPQRERLYRCALDNLLGAALVFGAPAELAVRARLMAMEVYAHEGDPSRATALAEDIVSFHTDSTEAKAARELLHKHPPDVVPN